MNQSRAEPLPEPPAEPPGGALAGWQNVGLVWRAQPGRVEDYRRQHASVWPELEEVLHTAGVHRYAIYAWGETLFGHLEAEDFDRVVAVFNASPLAERWEASMADLIEYPDADEATGWPHRLTHVWSLPPAKVTP